MNTLRKAADEVKRQMILDVLLLENGNQCATARRLGIHRNTLATLIRQLGIRLNGSARKNRRAA